MLSLAGPIPMLPFAGCEYSQADESMNIWPIPSPPMSTQSMRQRVMEAKKGKGPSIARDGWLSRLTLNERGELGPQAIRSGVRASDKGFLSLKLAEYLQRLDWTSCQHSGSLAKAVVPENLAPILTRIGVDGNMFRDLV